MKDLFNRDRKEELAFTEALLLEFMAWKMEPISLRQLTQLMDQLGVKSKEGVLLIEQALKANKLIKTKNTQNQNDEYALPAKVHLDMLWNLKDKPSRIILLYESIYRYSQWGNLLNMWRYVFLSLANGTPVTSQYMPHTIDSDKIILTLCKEMTFHPLWKEVCTSLPEEPLFLLYHQAEREWSEDLLQPQEEFLQHFFLNNDKLPARMRDAYNDSYLLPKYVLSGQINKIPAAATLATPNSLCIQAIYHQYQGEYAKSTAKYQQALKVMNTHIFRDPLFDTLYVLSLINDGEASSKKKLAVLYKKKDYRENGNLLPALLLLRYSQHEDMNEVPREIPANIPYASNLSKLLLTLLIEHYCLKNYQYLIDTAWATSLINKDHLKLFQLEFSQDFPFYKNKADELKKELGLTPLLPPYKQLTEWEKALEILLDLTAGKTAATALAGKTESQSRIIYYIDKDEQITPRLQKSKNGISWSKGRNIALNTFKQQAVEEMNETDRHLSACVQLYTGGWGYCDFYKLCGPEAFAVLAGYPLVFQAENPDVPIIITQEEPQVIMTKAPGGYQVSINVAPPFDASNLVRKENDQLYRTFTLSATQRKVLEVFSRIPYFPVTAKESLAELLNRISGIITVHSDLLQSDEKLKTVKGDALITVQLQPMGDGVKVELFVKPFIEHPPYCKAGKGAGSVIGVIKGKRVQAVRNLKKESENFELISQLMKKVSGDKTATDVLFFDDYYQCLELIDALREQTKIARTEWPEGVKFTINRSADFSNLSLSLKGVGQWFEVEGELKVDARTQIKIAELLQKVRESKGRFIALNDSEFLALSQQLRHQLEEIDSLLLRDKKKLQVSQFNASTMGEMEQMGISLTKDKAFSALQKRMEEADKAKFTIPKTLQAELRGYQEDGFRWMSRLAHWGAGACLADDMGLGKTIQAIALMLSRGQRGASLVIAPASVLLNWKSEIERFAPSLSSLVMHDADNNRKALVDNADKFDVVLTTYGLLVNEAELLASKSWNIIILDEAHIIKNKETKMSKSAMELKGEFRLLLTGTPLQNHLGEIWNLFQFANPGLLGSFQHFNEHFILPIEKEEDKQQQKQLKKLLQPFLLRRTKAQVLDELPEKTEITLTVELSAEERALYENLRQQAVLNLEESSSGAMQALAEITRLRQAACHPALINKELNIASSKTQAFLKLAEELMNNNHRALVFSQFTSHLSLIRKELDEKGIEYLYLDGSTSVNERTNLVKRFQTGEQPLFLISLKAGGTGLNLTAADYVIHMDPWWNPAVEDQASDRVHRIGQTRPVTIYRLISTETIEEKIIKLHQTKKSLADSLLDGSDIAHKLTKEDLLELLRAAN